MLPLEQDTRQKLTKAIRLLKKSLERSTPLLTKPFTQLTDEELETLEGFASRFGRAANIGSRRLLRGLVLNQEPDFSGSTRDLLNYCEKKGFISSSSQWLRLKEVRNLIVHEYEDNALEQLYHEIFKLSSVIIDLEKLL